MAKDLEQVSLLVPRKVVKDAIRLLEAESFRDDPMFKYARLNRSLVYREALEIGLAELKRRYIGGPPRRRKADQPTTPPPVQLMDPLTGETRPAIEPTRPTAPTRPTTIDAEPMTGAE